MDIKNKEMPQNWFSPTTLEGKLLRLIPLESSHRQALLDAANNGNLHELWYTSVPSEKTINTYLAFAFEEQKQARALPFAVIDKKTDTLIGTTRYCNAEPKHKRLEIGYTWYSKSVQRTGINTECKYLLLRYAFENLEAIAVELRTHWHNHPSRNAIQRLGAKQDGVLRNHRIHPDGSLRDTVVYSILNTEWPVVKKSLTFKMNKQY